MKQQYIKQVSKKLNVSKDRKKEIIRDLEEAFASAIEHGETEQQVIERLGSPEQFANSMCELDSHNGKKRGVVGAVISICVAVLSFAIYGITKSQQPPEGAIGYADAVTNIQVEGAFSFDISLIILIVGLLAAAIAVIQIIRIVHKNNIKG